MKPIKTKVIKTENGYGGKCKTYLHDLGDVLFFEKYTLYKKPSSVEFYPCGEEIVRNSKSYMFTYHYFSIKKSTLETLFT